MFGACSVYLQLCFDLFLFEWSDLQALTCTYWQDVICDFFCLYYKSV